MVYEAEVRCSGLPILIVLMSSSIGHQLTNSLQRKILREYSSLDPEDRKLQKQGWVRHVSHHRVSCTADPNQSKGKKSTKSTDTQQSRTQPGSQSKQSLETHSADRRSVSPAQTLHARSSGVTSQGRRFLILVKLTQVTYSADPQDHSTNLEEGPNPRSRLNPPTRLTHPLSRIQKSHCMVSGCARGHLAGVELTYLPRRRSSR